MSVLLWLLIGHALCDFPLQGEFLARGKNHLAPLPGIAWFQCLFAHAAIHAGAVLWITNSSTLCICEFVSHSLIDYAKCDNRFGFGVDQLLHILCKLIWFAVFFLQQHLSFGSPLSAGA